ncbi:MAG TPA: DUF389 domain-containing protein [Candidatus Limnocylindrales bacterium]|nr:DUF389 domain-containing protein [Candidatus Limnocylindrales bacterium]
MLHLRILVPGDLSASVESMLLGEPGAVHVSVVAGASRDPSGDLIEADVVRATLGPIISRLEDLHVPERGSISFVELGDVRSQAAETASVVEAGFGEELISWDEVAARTRDDTSFTWAYGVLMILAGVIAAGGILTNNELLIVGAMIVSPDYGPLAGFCVAVVGGLAGRARSSASALFVGFVFAALSAATIGIVARAAGLVPDAYLSGERPVAQLISEPDAASLIVALAAGVAGIIALGQAKSGAIVGVLVSVTTIPAVANIGVALAFANPDEVIGALAQLSINVAGLVSAGLTSLWLGHRLSRRRAIAEIQARRRQRGGRGKSVRD